MVNIDNISNMFVELLYRKEMPVLSENNAQYAEQALAIASNTATNPDWMCDTFTTMNTPYNLLEDKNFAAIFTECGTEVFKFASCFGVTSNNLRCAEGWLNIAMPGQYQEFHRHPMSHFSAVYYVQTPDRCGNIVFRNPSSESDMFPLPTTSMAHPNFRTFYQTAKAGELLIFRSNMAHMVMKNQSTEPRISIAMNYVFLPDS